MYPSRELTLLAARRETLRTRIEYRRADCEAAVLRLGSGVRQLATWGRLLRLGGLAGAVGVGWYSLRRRRRGDAAAAERAAPTWLARLLRWAPVAIRLARLAALRF